MCRSKDNNISSRREIEMGLCPSFVPKKKREIEIK
jgi:hypothetical protein